MNEELSDELEALNRKLLEAFKVCVRLDPDRAAAWLKRHDARLRATLQAAKPK